MVGCWDQTLSFYKVPKKWKSVNISAGAISGVVLFKYYLQGGGFKYWKLSPRRLRKWSNLTTVIYFSDGLVQTTNSNFLVCKKCMNILCIIVSSFQKAWRFMDNHLITNRRRIDSFMVGFFHCHVTFRACTHINITIIDIIRPYTRTMMVFLVMQHACLYIDLTIMICICHDGAFGMGKFQKGVRCSFILCQLVGDIASNEFSSHNGGLASIVNLTEFWFVLFFFWYPAEI